MADRVPLLAGNWKMHGSPSEARRLATDIRKLLTDIKDRDVLLAPPYPALLTVVECVKGSGIAVGGQDLYWADQGAFTGEVSAPMIADCGCTHVIVGHSERRQHFGETDASVALKLRAALRHALTPVVCVGETLDQREADLTLRVVEAQVRAALDGLEADQVSRLVMAYEPLWAIGTGRVATPAQAQEVHRQIRGLLAAAAGSEVAAQVRILYGGSVKPDNIDALMREPDVDGALVGGASLNAPDFARIVRFEP